MPLNNINLKEVTDSPDYQEILKRLGEYVRAHDYSGYDPYDGLNSRIFHSSPLYSKQILRLGWIQLFKRNPFNLRSISQVPKSFNPKAGGLFLSSNIKLYQNSREECYKKECAVLFKRLHSTVIIRPKGIAWGYNFDWQAKAFFVPQGTPNIVTCVYIGNALLDYYEAFHNPEAKTMAGQIKEFILNEMIIDHGKEDLCFAYIPGEKAEVHNANLLAAAFLSRMDHRDHPDILTLIAKSVEFSIRDIKENGYWPYGKRSHHRWMDHFHTAFNLESLLTIKKHLKTDQYDQTIKKVYVYYIRHFFLKDGTPKYYHNKIYPIDIHTIAEAIVLLTKVVQHNGGIWSENDKDLARKCLEQIINLAVEKFWDKKGYFYYQQTRFFMNKIPYIRWSQAWMLYALSCYLSWKGSENVSAHL